VRDCARVRNCADHACHEQEKAGELAAFLFTGDGPCFAVAKIGLSEDPWSLPIKDGAAIARRFRIALE